MFLANAMKGMAAIDGNESSPSGSMLTNDISERLAFAQRMHWQLSTGHRGVSAGGRTTSRSRGRPSSSRGRNRYRRRDRPALSGRQDDRDFAVVPRGVAAALQLARMAAGVAAAALIALARCGAVSRFFGRRGR
jgi:hypothetical protein